MARATRSPWEPSHGLVTPLGDKASAVIHQRANGYWLNIQTLHGLLYLARLTRVKNDFPFTEETIPAITPWTDWSQRD